MKTTWKTACALSSALCLLVVTQAVGQVRQPGQPGLERGQTERSQIGREATGQQKFCLASKVKGMTVKDKSNQSVGQIQDMVIDQSGQVKFLAISTQEQAGTDATKSRLQPERTPGAQAGLKTGHQGKLTLVPYEAVQFHDGETEAQNYAMINIDKDRLTQAPSFTEQQLTAKGQEAQWMTQVNQFFNRGETGAARPDLNNQNQQNQNQKNQNPQNRNQQNRDE